jgi:hypothetical protein
LGKYLTQEQVNRIQGLLKLQNHNTKTLAAKLRRPLPTVISNINGTRRNPEVRAEIARFLGLPVEALFGGNGQGAHDD